MILDWWRHRRAVRRGVDEMTVWLTIARWCPEPASGAKIATLLLGVLPPRRTYAAVERMARRGWLRSADAPEMAVQARRWQAARR